MSHADTAELEIFYQHIVHPHKTHKNNTNGQKLHH